MEQELTCNIFILSRKVRTFKLLFDGLNFLQMLQALPIFAIVILSRFSFIAGKELPSPFTLVVSDVIKSDIGGL